MEPGDDMRARRDGFPLIELLVVIGVIAILMSMLLPSMGRLRDEAFLLGCGNNLRQIVGAALVYAGQNRGEWPGPNWGSGGAQADQDRLAL